MLRVLLLLAALALTLPAAFACDMRASSRSAALSDYVTNGKTCLDRPPAEFSFDRTAEAMFVEAVNEARVEHGLNRLILRAALRPSARFHSLDMGQNDFFAHESPDGRSHAARIAAFDRTLLAEGTAENLAQFGPSVCVDHRDREVSCSRVRGFRAPERVDVVRDLHQRLMESEGHRRNILDPDMTHIAVGVARTETGFYVTQLFADVLGDLSRPAPLTAKATEALTVFANVPGWDVANLALSHGEETIDLDMGRIPTGITGQRGLSVRAEITQEFDEGPITRTLVTWIYPSGPTIEIVPATGS